MLDLILKDIDDPYSRENFFRLKNFLSGQVLFEGDFKLFDISIPEKSTPFKVAHGLSFIPADVIPLSAVGNLNYFFRYQEFTKEFIYITTDGPVRLRFLAGKLKDRAGALAAAEFPIVSLGETLPASPGFLYAAIDTKTAGFWLTSDVIPTNIAGIPVLFGDAVVIKAAVSTELDVNYSLGIYQHEGNEVGLTLLGTIVVTAGGPKRFAFEYPVIYSSPNVQLACRLLTGTTKNLKVSLVLKGSTV